jgi:hypothetical protein
VSRRIPNWVLERSLVGELPEGFTEADLAADPTVPERLAALKQSDTEILEKLPPAQVAARVRQRAGQRRESRPSFRWVPVAVAAGLIAVVTPVVWKLQSQGPDVLTKGLEAHLEVFRQRAGGAAEPLSSGALAKPGDVVQLRVVGAGEKLGAVVAVDGTGEVTPVTPAPVPLPPSGSVTLPDALELDATGDFERFILVTSDGPFDVGEVLAAAHDAGTSPDAPLHLREGLKQRSFVLLKRAR